MAEQYFRRYFHHAAVQNAVRAGEIEEMCKGAAPTAEIEGRPKGRWQPIYHSHALMSIIASYTTLEVCMKEFTREGFHPVVRKTREWPERIFKYFKGGNAFQISQTILEMSSADKFDPSENLIYENAKLVQGLRNYFVHHYPEWIDVNDDPPQTQYGGALRAKDFEIDLIWLDEDSIYFPSKCLGFGLAKWCIEAITDYVDEFERRLDIEHPLLGKDEIYMADLHEVK